LPEASNKLLVIDDHEDLCEYISEVSTNLGYESRSVTSPEEFCKTYPEFQPSLVVLDLQLPGGDGV
jgi:DNA-binding response OmpR family regulator